MLLALPSGFSARAEIVYSGPQLILTRDHFVSAVGGEANPFILDLNGDGAGEFSFFQTGHIVSNHAFVAPLATAAFAGIDAMPLEWVKPIAAGDIIGPLNTWRGSPATGFPTLTFNPPLQSGPLFVGLRFSTSVETRYGWVEYSSSAAFGFPASFGEITGWAYESLPDTSIVAGDRGSLVANPVPEPMSFAVVAALGLGLLVAKRLRDTARAARN